MTRSKKVARKAADTSLLLLAKNPLMTAIPAVMLGVDVQRQQYEELMAGVKLPFKNKRLDVMFFFPYEFWDKHCEPAESKTLYGVNRDVYLRFRSYWGRVAKKVLKLYPEKDVRFVISPDAVYVDRDKILTHDILEKAGVRTTRTLVTRDLTEILREATAKRGVFVKCRYGAEGKGITRIREGEWVSNYVRKGHEPANHPKDTRWTFTDVTGDRAFVNKLLAKDVIVEREIVTVRKTDIGKFDVRVHVVGDKVVHMFVRHTGRKSVTTNWSQGGTAEHDYASILTKEQIASATKESLKAAKALGAEFLGVDCMFDVDAPNDAIVVEAQCLCDFPKLEVCNLGEKLVRFIIKKA